MVGAVITTIDCPLSMWDGTPCPFKWTYHVAQREIRFVTRGCGHAVAYGMWFLGELEAQHQYDSARQPAGTASGR